MPEGPRSSQFDGPGPKADGLEALRSGAVVLNCDAPSFALSDVALALPIQVVGWAYSRAGIDRVIVTVDEHSIPASLGLPRQDVADQLGEPGARNCGFAAMLDRDRCPPGPHRLTVVALDRRQRSADLSTTIIAQPGEVPAKPRGAGASDGDQAEIWSERYVPERHRGAPIEAEHEGRYSWVRPLAAGRDVLDAGCGVGWGTLRLASAGARHATGLDIDEAALSDARRRAGAAAEFVPGDLLSLPFDDDSFDLAVCFEAIEHVRDPGRALDELRRVLRPGGILAVSSPNRGVYAPGNPFHVHEFTSSELEASLKERFETVDLYRQQTYAGSLVTDDHGYTEDNPLTEVDVRLHKMSAGRPGEELYTVALAGTGALPSMQSVAVLTAGTDSTRTAAQLAQLDHRARRAEAELAALRGELAASRDELEHTRETAAEARRADDRLRLDAERRGEQSKRELEALRGSLSWRVTGPLRAGKRRLLAALRARHDSGR